MIERENITTITGDAKGSASLRTRIPAYIRDLLELHAKDELLWHSSISQKGEITIVLKKKE